MLNAELGQGGFSLVELVMVIVILAVLATIAVGVLTSTVDTARFDATTAEMVALEKAIVGDDTLQQNGLRTAFGYVGDIGGLPSSLDRLVTQAGEATWAAGPVTGQYMGWHGPYIGSTFTQNPNDYKTDACGNTYSWTQATGVLTTTCGGQAITRNVLAKFRGDVTGVVSGAGGAPINAATVRVYYPSNGSESNASATTNATGSYTITNVPIGKHKIRVEFGGTNYPFQDAVVVPGAGTTNVVNLSITADTFIPCQPTVVTATRGSLSSIAVSWTAPTTNTPGGAVVCPPNGTALTDLDGYNVSRSTNNTTYTLVSSQGPTTGYTDSSLPPAQTFYYRVNSRDGSGNLSANGTGATYYTTVNPIGQTGTAATFTAGVGGGCPLGTLSRIDLTISNNAVAGGNGANITVSTAVVSWTGIGGSLLAIQSPAGTTIWSGTAGNGATVTLTSPFTINAATNRTMRLCFSAGLTSVAANGPSVQLNTVDGRFNLY